MVNESGLLVRDIVEEAKQRAEKESRRILTYAIQRYASDCTYERTTATIPLPNDEMKGRIIGREGRNIRAQRAGQPLRRHAGSRGDLAGFDRSAKMLRAVDRTPELRGAPSPVRIEELSRKSV